MQQESRPLVDAYGAIEELLNEVTTYVNVIQVLSLSLSLSLSPALSLIYMCVHCSQIAGVVAVSESLGHGDW